MISLYSALENNRTLSTQNLEEKLKIANFDKVIFTTMI